MALKMIQKSVALTSDDKKVAAFISKGGSLPEAPLENEHRLTLRIPRDLMNKIDEKRKKRIGKISRNLFILESLERFMEDL